jgi:hypothetical protein
VNRLWIGLLMASLVGFVLYAVRTENLLLLCTSSIGLGGALQSLVSLYMAGSK